MRNPEQASLRRWSQQRPCQWHRALTADSILPRVNETQRDFARIDGFVVKAGIPKVGYGLIDDFGKELVH